jgi:hypothetical protein
MAKVYLETSFFSACVSVRTGAKSVGWRASSLEWWNQERKYFELFVSTEVYNELAAPDFPQSAEALAMLAGINLLRPDGAVAEIATMLVEQKVMPGPATTGDAVHVAIAMANRMDYILTWNVKHLANPNKRIHLATLCLRLGIPMPQLVTTDLLKGGRNHE